MIAIFPCSCSIHCCFTTLRLRPLNREPLRFAEGVNCRLQVAGAGCRLQVAGCRLQVAGCRLQVAGCDYIFFKQKMYDPYMVRFYLNFFKKIRIVSFVKKPW